MKNNLIKTALAAGFALALAFTFSCSDTDNHKERRNIKKERVSGISQKGPFVNANVTIYELNEKFEKTNVTSKGKTDDKGYFDIEIENGELASPYIILEVKGRYFNEVKGELTATPITLKAIADVSNKDTANINALTHLEFDKVLELVKGGKDFYEAKSQAQKEVLETFNINEKGMMNSENADIFGSSRSDSVLLVVSILLQGNRQAAEVSDLLDKFDKGEPIIDEVKKGLENVDVGKVMDYIRSQNPNAKEPDISPYLPQPSSSSFEHISSSSFIFVEPSSSSEAGQLLSSSSGSTYSGGGYTPPSGGGTPPILTPSSSTSLASSSSESHSSSSEAHSSSSHASSSSEAHSSSSEAHSSSSIATAGTFTDIRGGTYNWVTIGTQTWMAENLNYDASGSKCYNNDPANCAKYGRLYDWATAMDNSASSSANPSGVQGVCPSGWHLPSDAEWDTLMTAVGGTSTAGTKLKAADGWNLYSGVPVGTDDYGFSALPGGSGLSSGDFESVGKYGFWWSSTELNASIAYYWDMYYNGASVNRDDYGKTLFFSVRCVKD